MTFFSRMTFWLNGVRLKGSFGLSMWIDLSLKWAKTDETTWLKFVTAWRSQSIQTEVQIWYMLLRFGKLYPLSAVFGLIPNLISDFLLYHVSHVFKIDILSIFWVCFSSKPEQSLIMLVGCIHAKFQLPASSDSHKNSKKLDKSLRKAIIDVYLESFIFTGCS
jgi:hypothetical protein